MTMPVQSLLALGLGVGQVLGASYKPVSLPPEAQANKAALAIRHVQGLLDCTTDQSLREVVALAVACLQYHESACRAAAGRKMRVA